MIKMECVTTEYVETQTVGLSKVHVAELQLKERNQRDLGALQRIISMEEGRAPSTEEVMCRVLSFYNRFVPFKDNA